MDYMKEALLFSIFLLQYLEYQIWRLISIQISLYFEKSMSRSSAQKSAVNVPPPAPKKPQGPPPFDPSKYATKNITADDVLKLKECFDVFDYDKSGRVSPQQLVTAIKALGLQKDAAKILHLVQTQSQSQQMDFAQFLQIFGFSSDTNSEKSLQQLFEVFDKSGTGTFGVEEFTKVCEQVGERFSQTQIQQMIQYADKDGDGRISYQEFVEIVVKEYPTV